MVNRSFLDMLRNIVAHGTRICLLPPAKGGLAERQLDAASPESSSAGIADGSGTGSAAAKGSALWFKATSHPQQSLHREHFSQR